MNINPLFYRRNVKYLCGHYAIRWVLCIWRLAFILEWSRSPDYTEVGDD